MRNAYHISRGGWQNPTEALIDVLLTPAKRVLGRAEAGCVSGSVAVPGCCSPFDASTALLTFPPLTLPCLALWEPLPLEGLRGCHRRAWPQSLCMVTLRGCSPRAQLRWAGHAQVPGDRLQRPGRGCRGTGPHLSHEAAWHHPAPPWGLRQHGHRCAGARAGSGQRLASHHGNSLSPPPLLTRPGGFIPASMPANGQATARRISPTSSCR